MQSTSGEHYIALDHLRALAALLVFSWHFMHGGPTPPVSLEFTPAWSPLIFFDEGHVGVALFMTLSGYLFARLLDGKRVLWRQFYWNRALRLLPLLVVVFAINAVTAAWQAHDVRAAYAFLSTLPSGIVFPGWPNGAWSITVELHFYLLLPLLLWLLRGNVGALWGVLALAIAGRIVYYAINGEVQSVAYWTIVGRIDQFLLGIIAFHARRRIVGKTWVAAAVAIAFITVYWWFDRRGGFFLNGGYPSPSRQWILLPTVEGMSFAVLIAWYDGSFAHRRGPFSTMLMRLGEYSYAIYLLHLFFVYELAHWIHTRVIDLSNYYVALAVSIAAFVAMLPVGYLSMRYIERPFLRKRRRYTVAKEDAEDHFTATQSPNSHCS
jgi:peptidoglycan/LPS O-acetylase OafA/YrhL